MAKTKVNNETKPRELIGQVVSVKNNTMKVRVESKFSHKKYSKIVKSHKTYLADYRGEEVINPGSEVKIFEVRPVSRKKTWKFAEVLKAVE